jgi:outer membrane protein
VPLRRAQPARSGRRPMSARIRPSLLRFRSLLWVLSAVLVTPLPAPAEPLSLTGALELARDNNPSLRQSAARRRAAEAGLSEARRSRLPAVELREIALRTDSPADAFGLQLMQERFSFPEFVNTDPNRPAALNNYAAEIEAQMPLFTGGRLSGGIRQAGAMARAAGDAQRHAGSAVELAVTGAYLNAQLADRAAALARRARETTSRHVEQAQAFFAAGMIVESDLLQAKVQLARMEEGAITAANDSVLARAALNRALGLEQDRQWELDPAPPDPPLPATNLEEALAGARDRRADLQAARENARAAEAGITVARGALLPEIGLSAKASFNDGKIFGSHGSSTTLLAVARWTPWDWGKGLAGLARSRAERTAADEAVREFSRGRAGSGIGREGPEHPGSKVLPGRLAHDRPARRRDLGARGAGP